MSTVAVYEEEDPGEEGKVCSLCAQMLPEFEFYVQSEPRYIARPMSACKRCTGKQRRAREYKISHAEVDQLWAQETCELCMVALESGQSSNSLAIDHCHATGKVRAAICSSCNRAIGFARESPETLRRMAAYLETHSEC